MDELMENIKPYKPTDSYFAKRAYEKALAKYQSEPENHVALQSLERSKKEYAVARDQKALHTLPCALKWAEKRGLA